MSSRLNYFFGQKVTESELDLGFELLEQADRDLASDVGIYGIISDAEPVPRNPVPDLSVDLTAPCRAYDRLGQRIYFATEQNVDCSLDTTGIPTVVHTAGNERWLAIFLKFDRLESDPRTDGNSQKVYFRRDESYQIVVRQGPEGPEGAAPKVAIEEDALLVCDVRRTAGQSQIREVDIDTTRRQNFIFAEADAVEVISGGWGVVQPAIDTVQSSLDSIDEHLTGHLSGATDRHTAADIDNTPHGFIAASNVQDAFDDIVDKLSSAQPGVAGAQLIGSDGEGGTPHALTTSNIRAQLGQLLGWLNTHLNKTSGAHNASTIAAAAHEYLTSPSVQGQLQQLVVALTSLDSTPGASRIGNKEIDQGIVGIDAGTLEFQLDTLAAMLDVLSLDLHAVGQEFDAHNHDDRYIQITRSLDGVLAKGENPLPDAFDELPAGINLRVQHIPDALPTIYYAGGSLLSDVIVEFTPTGDRYTALIRNNTDYELNFHIDFYTEG